MPMILGKDFGKQGVTYEIVEEGFISMIKRRLAKIDVTELNRKMILTATRKVNEPVAVRGLNRTVKAREFYYDPTYILLKDINLPCGKLLHKAGVAVNPLDHMDFDRRLIFIDGRDKEQTQWLQKLLVQQHNKQINSKEESAIQTRVILTGGKILELQEKLQETLYFDQAGELTDKFGIQQVPAIVEQEGNKLRIQEIGIQG